MNWSAFLEALPWISAILAGVSAAFVISLSVRNLLLLRKQRDTLRKADTRAALASAELSTLGYHLFERLGSASVRNYMVDDEVRSDIDEALAAVKEYLRDPAPSGDPDPDPSETRVRNSKNPAAVPALSAAATDYWTSLAAARRDLGIALSRALDLNDLKTSSSSVNQLLALARQRAIIPAEEVPRIRKAVDVANKAVHGVEIDPDTALESLSVISECTARLSSKAAPEAIKAAPRSRAATINVVRGDGGWEVRRPGAARASAIRSSQDDAVDRARDLVYRSGGGEVVIYGSDGRIRARDTVASNDPRMSKT